MVLPILENYTVPHLLTRIFMLLDPASLDNCLLVNKTWYGFVTSHILQNPKLQRLVEDKQVGSTWFQRTPRIKELNLKPNATVQSTWQDDEQLFIITKSVSPLHYGLSIFNGCGSLIHAMDITDNFDLLSSSVERNLKLIFTPNKILVDCNSSALLIDRKTYERTELSIPEKSHSYYGMYGDIASANSAFYFLAVEHVCHYIFTGDELTVAMMSDWEISFRTRLPLPIPRSIRHYEENDANRHSLCNFRDSQPRIAIHGTIIVLACRHGYIGIYNICNLLEPHAEPKFFVRHTQENFQSVKDIFIQRTMIGVSFQKENSDVNLFQGFDISNGDLIFSTEHRKPAICLNNELLYFKQNCTGLYTLFRAQFPTFLGKTHVQAIANRLNVKKDAYLTVDDKVLLYQDVHDQLEALDLNGCFQNQIKPVKTALIMDGHVQDQPHCLRLLNNHTLSYLDTKGKPIFLQIPRFTKLKN